MIEIIIILLVVIALGVWKLVKVSSPQETYVPKTDEELRKFVSKHTMTETEKIIAVVICILVIIALLLFAFFY